jgi:cytochrome c biogenesis protein CcmG/thiol:disulfide interchange protein DsbE
VRRGRVAVWAAGAAGIVVALFVAMLATRESAASRLAETPLAGRPAPLVRGTSVTDGTAFDLEAARGRWVVVNFFATWCIPCREEHPELVRFNARHPEIAIVSVIYSDEVDDVRAFFARNGGGWPVLRDPGGRIALDYGVRGVPESFVIDPAGLVRGRIVGGVTATGLERVFGMREPAG